MRNLAIPTLASSLLFVSLAIAGCAADASLGSGGGTDPVDDQELKAPPDKSSELFLGKWESTTKDVPAVGPLPFETNIRSLEFRAERADSSRYARYRMIEVVRPSCDDCRDETEPDGTYRSIADKPSDLTRGKLYRTNGGHQATRDFYEFDGDILRLKATGLGADSRTVVREFRRIRTKR